MNINMKSLKHHEYVSIGSQNPTHRIILLHGWGADANDLLLLGEQITKKLDYKFEIISLRAPHNRPDDNGRQWYSLFPANWEESKTEVNKLVSTITAFGHLKIPLKNTVLLGFSQGAAMSIDAGFRMDLGLIVSCSGYEHPCWNPKTKSPILISHGVNDDVVPIESSRNIYLKLRNHKIGICELHEFLGGHEIDMDFIEIIRSKIKQLF
tara:strand:- start:2070 stop:2696 length:627 start_codon:yes stop_codon:yes gene_type:complete